MGRQTFTFSHPHSVFVSIVATRIPMQSQFMLRDGSYLKCRLKMKLTFFIFVFLIQDCIFLGAGGSSVTEYQSIIFYHNSSPKWNETIKVNF